MKKKNIIMMVGLPCSGKSKEIEKLKRRKDYYVISNDDIINEVIIDEKFLNSIGIKNKYTYDDTFKSVPKDIDVKKYNENPSLKYGKIIEIEVKDFSAKMDENGDFPNKIINSYKIIEELKKEIYNRYYEKIKSSMKQEKDIILDRTNLTINLRSSILEKIESTKDNSIVNILEFRNNNIEEVIKNNNLRSKLLSDKNLPDFVLRSMDKNRENVTIEELNIYNGNNKGKLRVINVDNDSIRLHLEKKLKEKNESNESFGLGC